MFKVGIIGAGWIAEKMAEALAPLEDYRVYAIASRSTEKAKDFSPQKPYGPDRNRPAGITDDAAPGDPGHHEADGRAP